MSTPQAHFYFKSHTLDFTFTAGTSKGTLKQKQSWYLVIEEAAATDTAVQPPRRGIGEAGPLHWLSPEPLDQMEAYMQQTCQQLATVPLPTQVPQIATWVQEQVPASRPAIRFALETALLDYMQGGRQLLFHSTFTQGQQGLPVNGLIWMGTPDFMRQQASQKLAQGYTCLKMKIGAIGFEEEMAILTQIRQDHPDLILRVDANGAFAATEAMEVLKTLAKLNIHSIEQPIAPGQWHEMGRLCAQTPTPIALDEELIGHHELQQRQELLSTIKPQYIVLKPTLVGGLHSTRQWIDLAQQNGLGWWLTSMLESNIGLNAISQFTATLNVQQHQGLGTGQLYHNNISSPLHIESGYQHYRPAQGWNLAPLGL